MTDRPEPTEPTSEPQVKRASFTLSEHDLALLRRIARRRHEHDPRALSLTVRELIREEAARLERHERSGK